MKVVGTWSVRASLAVLLLCVPSLVCQTAQSGHITFVGQLTTLAGNGTNGYSGDGGPATQAMLGGYLSGTYIDGGGNLLICDAGNARIRKVDSHTGNITTIAGTGTAAYTGDGGLATKATLDGPDGIVVDNHGNIFIAEFNNKAIREITPDGKISTFAYMGFQITDIAIDGANNLYVPDYYNQQIWKVTPQGVRTLFAGTGSPGYSGDGGPATQARLFNPNSISADAAGNIYFADAANDVIRKIDINGTITTFAGMWSSFGYSGDGGPATSAQFRTPSHPGFDRFGNVYIPDNGNNVIRVVDTNGNISTFAGNANEAYTGDGGAGLNGSVDDPRFLNVDSSGNIYFTDSTDIRALIPTTSLLLDTTQSSVTINVQNTGSAVANLLSLLPSPAYIVSGGTCQANSSLAVGAICTVTLSLSSGSGPLVAGTLTITSDAADPKAVLTLSTGSPLATTTALQVNPSTITYGDSSTLTATVTPTSGIATGNVSFQDAGNAINAGPVTLDNTGLASVTVTPAAGTYTLTANFSGTGNFQNSTSPTQMLTVNTAPVQVTLVSSVPTVASGQSVTFTVQVTPANTSGTGATPSGLVDLLDGSTRLGRSSLDASGSAAFTISTLSVGTHTLTVDYSGSPNYQFGISAPFSFTVTPSQNTTTALQLSRGTIALGDSVTLTATVAGASSTPAGSVMFTDSTGSVTVGPVTVDGNGVAVAVVKPAAVGSYSLTASFHGGTGFNDSTSTAQVLQVVAAPVAVISMDLGGAPSATADVSQIAEFDPGRSTASGAITSYQWHFSDTGTDSQQMVPQHTFSAPGTYTVTLVITDSLGFSSAPATFTVTVVRTPVAALTVPSGLAPVGQVISFDGSASTGSNITRYNWSFGDGNSGSTTTPTTAHTYAKAGNYTATLTITDSQNETSAASVNITAGSAPVAVINMDLGGLPSTTADVSQITEFDPGRSTSSATITGYQWHFSDTGANSQQMTPQHTFSASGTYTVSLTVTDSLGLTSAPATLTVTVVKAPLASLTGPSGLSPVGQKITLDGSASTGGSITAYNWNYGDGSSGSTTTPTVQHIYAKPGNYTATLTVTDSQGETSAASINITAGNAPVAVIDVESGSGAASTVTAVGVPLQFEADRSTSSGTITGYKWTFSDTGATSSQDDLIHTFSTAGTYTVTLTVTDSLGLTSAPATITITVVKTPVAVISAPAATVTGDAVTFDGSKSTSGGAITSYLWDFGDGTHTQASSTTIDHIYTVAGTYTVALQIVDSNGFTSPAAMQALKVFTAPVALMTAPTSAEPGTAISFSGSRSTSDGTIAKYIWSFGDGTFISASTDPTPHTYAAAGTYTVVLQVTDSNGFTSHAEIKSILIVKKPVAAISGPATTVTGDAVTFDGSKSTSGGTITSYLWDFGDGAHFQASSTSVDHIYFATGTYTVALQIVDSNGFTSPASIQTIKVFTAPVALMTAPTSAEPGTAISFSGSRSTSDGTIAKYNWSFGDGTFVTTSTDPTPHTYATAGTYTVVLQVTDSNGFTSHAEIKSILIVKKPVAAISGPATTVTGDAVTFDGSKSTSGGTITSYLWDFGDGTHTPASSTTIDHIYSAAGTYTVALQVVDSNGFTSPASIQTLKVFTAPVALMTAPTSAEPGTAISFSGSRSTSDGTIAKYIWSFGDNTFVTTPTDPTPHTYATAGTYTVVLQVTDSNGFTSHAEIKSILIAKKTVAVISAPATNVTGAFVTFDGSQSTSGGTITSYLWDFGDGTHTQASSTTIGHIYTAAGMYTVALQVVDSNGVTSPAAIQTLKVFAAPVAFITAPASAEPGAAVSFSGSASTSSGTIAKYDWNFGDGTFVTIPTDPTPHTYATAGTYTVVLQVTDSNGFTSHAAMKQIVVVQKPVAVFTLPSTPVAGALVTFDSSKSSLGAGLSQYVWNFGDGTPTVSSVSTSVSHRYTIAATYQVTLTVSDVLGGSSVASGALTVQPVATSISPGHSVAGTATTVTVTGVGFASGNVVLWNGAALATTFVNATQLTANVPAASVPTAGLATVSVQAGAGNNSNALSFVVDTSGGAPPTINPATYTVSRGGSISIPVSFQGNTIITGIACYNFPSGVTCNYDASAHAVVISVASTVTPGSYTGTIQFSEEVTIRLAGLCLLVLLPKARRHSRKIGLRMGVAAFALALLLGAVAGCASGARSEASSATSSVDITLDIQ